MNTKTTEFRSPVTKLMKSFHESRGKWKEKCLKAKQRVKRLQTNVADLEASRERWKQDAKKAQEVIAQLRAELEEQKITSL